jgi:DNA-directed RNA polymerase subunit omega
MLPSPDILNDFEHGKFVLSNLAAMRARQLAEGAVPLVHIDSQHPLTIALAEIAAGRIKAALPSADAVVIEETTVRLLDEAVPSELGVLLPALDETEAALVGTATLVGEDDHDMEIGAEDLEAGSLSDLLSDEEEEIVPPEAEVGDTLSLSDIAEEETAAEDESEE